MLYNWFTTKKEGGIYMANTKEIGNELREFVNLLKKVDEHQQALVLAFEKGIEIGSLDRGA